MITSWESASVEGSPKIPDSAVEAALGLKVMTPYLAYRLGEVDLYLTRRAH
jgi:hypothetical protein